MNNIEQCTESEGYIYMLPVMKEIDKLNLSSGIGDDGWLTVKVPTTLPVEVLRKIRGLDGKFQTRQQENWELEMNSSCIIWGYIYKSSGQYFAFLNNNFIFSWNGRYLGWTDKNHVWDSTGNYQGELVTINGNMYVMKNIFAIPPIPQIPRISPIPPVPPAPSAPVQPITLPTGYNDGLL
jgi:hypothetical protein